MDTVKDVRFTIKLYRGSNSRYLKGIMTKKIYQGSFEYLLSLYFAICSDYS